LRQNPSKRLKNERKIAECAMLRMHLWRRKPWSDLDKILRRGTHSRRNYLYTVALPILM